MAILRFYDSTHAKIRRTERQLTIEAMKNVVSYPDRRMQQYRGEHGGFVYRFSNVAGVGTLVVIAELKRNECWLISGWFEKQ